MTPIQEALVAFFAVYGFGWFTIRWVLEPARELLRGDPSGESDHIEAGSVSRYCFSCKCDTEHEVKHDHEAELTKLTCRICGDVIPVKHTDGGDMTPVVYDDDGNPMKVRMVGAECEGDVSGRGHYAYKKQTADADEPTIYFEEVDRDG